MTYQGRRRLVGAMALLFAGLPFPAGSQGAVGGGEPQAALMYDEAVELCGAGNARAFEECNALLQQSVMLFPDQALGHLTLGHTYRTLRAWNEAVSAFSTVIRCTRARAGSPEGAPDWAKEDAGIHLGRALIELDRWDEAILAFEATLTAFPANTEALFRHLYLQHFACNFTRRAGAHMCPYNPIYVLTCPCMSLRNLICQRAELLQQARERVEWEVSKFSKARK